ncbi:DUF3857 domain-containing protein [Edaphobacter albus]|uniref:DUF3857 domain-containing protein n=1 Tax=Edaphobacter sp. 4G125 TaxID=2763071 RepID=UPI0021072E22|nr:DUF3857 domain-containing protein [Edaphobacter sp. 4G125]
MTSQEGYPGIAGVYLNREEITEDKLHMWTVYVRLKVLTEKGKDYANVELKYGSSNSGGGYTVNNISGRTIHADGTIIPFTGKPYEKLIEKTQGYDGYKHMAKIFTMPSVEIGSIIEYRYSLRYDDYYFFAPSWFIQSDLYLRKGHYVWKPTDKQLVSKRDGHEQLTNSIGWFPVLPKDAQIQQTRLPAISPNPNGQLILSLDVHDVPPAPQEEYMPPISSFTYRVLFYYSPYRSAAEYWQSEGKYWSKNQDKFIGPGSKVAGFVHELTVPSDSQEQKLHKIYAAVMQIENTDFTRAHETAEDKAAGLREIHNTDDILDRKRGTSDQLTALFVAMARAAGMKAYVFAVTNRDRSMFTNAYLNMSQLDDSVAVVNLDGKEVYFDPGSRYCPYGHLDWRHTFAGGIRQTENGTALSDTPGEPYTFSRTQRIAELKMNEHGEVSGIVKLTYMGAPALAWRHRSLRGDDESFRRELRTNLEHLLPGGVDIKVINILQLENYEQPLTVEFTVNGPVGSPTGKRLFVPADIFMSNAKPAFPHEKRDLAIYFDYPHMVQDAIRIHLPATITAESVPSPDTEQFKKSALYTLTNEQKPDSVTIRRNFTLGEFLFDAKDYTELRAYYSKIENKDQENIVLANAPQTNAPKPALSSN